jgi:four helix bundle protein
MGIKGFKDLLVWQKAKDLSVTLYKVTGTGALGHDYGLRDQIRRAAVSIASNIAEGDERNTDKESVRFFFIAKGSLAELRTQLHIAYDVGYLAENKFHDLDHNCMELGKMIGKLIQVRQSAINNRQGAKGDGQ